MRVCVVVLAALALAGGAEAVPPVVGATATPTRGTAPLRGVLTATGDAAAYRWDLGDGTSAEGARIVHVYAPGTFVATVTALGATGETAEAQVRVVARRQTLTFRAPRVGPYATPVTLTGTLRPARRTQVRIYRGSTYVTAVPSGAAGRFRARILFRTPGAYHATLEAVLAFQKVHAIHGYPSVPAYPASHGCVRVPMWIAPSLVARHGYGATIVVYA